MALASIDAVTAVNRFGFGAKPGDLQTIGSDPRGWAKAQVQARNPATPAALANLPTAQSVQADFMKARKAGQEEQRAFARDRMRPIFLDEVAARTTLAIDGDEPLRERLVQFWSNHFTISIRGKPVLAGIAGAYEREAIRPHVTGRFADMLLAVVHHPAMLAYLDNAQSVGPNSRAGQRSKRGLNENLAREVMELHTLGVQGGYTQEDVTTFAKVLTGWSIARLEDSNTGGFHFFQPTHEPGDKTLLGRRFREDGEAEGRAVLDMLASHPSTAKFIATKLARHFVADDPPPRVVEALAKTFRDTGGDLARVTATLIDQPEVWASPMSKVKTPTEFVIGTFRALGGVPNKPEVIARSFTMLDQQAFGAPSPAGWPDRASDWLGPEALMRRIQWAQGVALKLPRPPAALDRADAILGAALGPDTRTAIQRAPSDRDALTLMLASAEFQRR